MSDLVVIARQRVSDRLTSHWVGCERDHFECLIQRMADEIERLTAERDAALDLVRWAYGKLNILVFSRMDDALKLDEMKLLLMQESSDE